MSVETDPDQFVRVLVGCGSKKRSTASKAKDLYTSRYFKWKRRFAEIYGDDWHITSAEHGLLDPDTVIEPYDKSLTNMDPAARRAWGSDTSEELQGLEWEHVDVVILLMGQLYIEPIEPTLETFPVTIGYPFDHTSGNVEQEQWLEKRVTEAKTAAPDETVSLNLDPIQEAAHNQQTLTEFET